MDWRQILAYVTGTVDEELLLRNEYLAAENRILRARIKGRLALTAKLKGNGQYSSSRTHWVNRTRTEIQHLCGENQTNS